MFARKNGEEERPGGVSRRPPGGVWRASFVFHMTSFRGELTRYFDDGGTVREQWELSASFLAIDDGSFLIDLADPGVDIEEGPPPSCFTLVCADGEARAMQADDEASCSAWVQRIAQALSEFQPSEALLMMAGAPALDREAVLRTTHALVVLCEEHVLAAQADLQLDVASGVDVEVEQAREELVDAHKFALSVAKEHADKTAQLLHWVHEIECSTAEQETRISTQADEIRALELELSEARAGGAGGGHGWYGGYDAAAACPRADCAPPPIVLQVPYDSLALALNHLSAARQVARVPRTAAVAAAARHRRDCRDGILRRQAQRAHQLGWKVKEEVLAFADAILEARPA